MIELDMCYGDYHQGVLKMDGKVKLVFELLGENDFIVHPTTKHAYSEGADSYYDVDYRDIIEKNAHSFIRALL